MVDYLKIGQIINTHGVKGEVKVYPLTDNVKRFSKLKQVYMKKGEEYTAFEIEGVKYLKNLVIIKLKGTEDMNAAIKLIDSYLFINRENAVKLTRDTYFVADLIGMDVFTIEGERLGKLIDVMSTGSNDVYEIKPDSGKTFLIPAIKDVVKEVDVESRKMSIVLLEGLL